MRNLDEALRHSDFGHDYILTDTYITHASYITSVFRLITLEEEYPHFFLNKLITLIGGNFLLFDCLTAAPVRVSAGRNVLACERCDDFFFFFFFVDAACDLGESDW